MTERALPLTELLNGNLAGNADVEAEAFCRIYDDLHAMAANLIAKERDDHTWEPSDLVNECYLRVLGVKYSFANRYHFFRVASETMRRLLIEYARRRRAKKRIEGNLRRTSIERCFLSLTESGVDMVELDEAMSTLSRASEHDAEIIKFRYIVGLNWKEIAALVGCSEAKVRKDAKRAEAFLRRSLEGDSCGDD